MFVLRCCGRVKVGADSCLSCVPTPLFIQLHSETRENWSEGQKQCCRNPMGKIHLIRFGYSEADRHARLFNLTDTVHIFFSPSPHFSFFLCLHTVHLYVGICALHAFLGSLKMVYKFTIIVIIISFLRQSNMQKYGHQRYLIFETNKTVKQKRHYVCSL